MEDLKKLLHHHNDDYRILEEARRLAPFFRALSARRQAHLLKPNNCHNAVAEESLIASLSSAEWRAFQDARVFLEKDRAMFD